MHMFLANGLLVPFSGLFSVPFLMLLNRPPGRLVLVHDGHRAELHRRPRPRDDRVDEGGGDDRVEEQHSPRLLRRQDGRARLPAEQHLQQEAGALAVRGDRGAREVELLERLGQRLRDTLERRARPLLLQRLGGDERAGVEQGC